MQLDLAVVLRCDNTTCHLQRLQAAACPDATCLDATYSAPMLEHRTRARPGQLVAIDTAISPPLIVYRWAHIHAIRTREGFALDMDGQPVTPDRLRADEFPKIEAMYARVTAHQERDPKQLVQESYDQIAERYLEWAQQDPNNMREKYASWLLNELHQDASVLELGCGAGVPATQLLAQHFQVTGVDLSARQLELARNNVPQARFIHADMAAVDLPAGSYDGVLSLFAIFHVPRNEQPRLLNNVAAWLRPGGLLIATMGTQSSAGSIEDDWLGAPMYWSTYDSETNVRMVQDAGLNIVRTEIETVEEFGETVRFLWIVARKPKETL